MWLELFCKDVGHHLRRLAVKLAVTSVENFRDRSNVDLVVPGYMAQSLGLRVSTFSASMWMLVSLWWVFVMIFVFPMCNCNSTTAAADFKSFSIFIPKIF